MKIEDIDRAVAVKKGIDIATGLLDRVERVAGYSSHKCLAIGGGIETVGVPVEQLSPGTFGRVIELIAADLATQVAEGEAIIAAL